MYECIHSLSEIVSLSKLSKYINNQNSKVLGKGSDKDVLEESINIQEAMKIINSTDSFTCGYLIISGNERILKIKPHDDISEFDPLEYFDTLYTDYEVISEKLKTEDNHPVSDKNNSQNRDKKISLKDLDEGRMSLQTDFNPITPKINNPHDQRFKSFQINKDNKEFDAALKSSVMQKTDSDNNSNQEIKLTNSHIHKYIGIVKYQAENTGIKHMREYKM